MSRLRFIALAVVAGMALVTVVVAAPVKALTVFTHPAAELDVEGGPIPACKIEKLRKQVTIPGERLSMESYEKLSSWLDRLTVR